MLPKTLESTVLDLQFLQAYGLRRNPTEMGSPHKADFEVGRPRKGQKPSALPSICPRRDNWLWLPASQFAS